MSVNVVFTIGATPVYRADEALLFRSGLELDCDGAFSAYHPPTIRHPFSGKPPGADDLRNAGRAGNWYGVVTDTGLRSGRPIMQGPSDPCPGFYVSQTALSDHSRGVRDPRRYVDALSVPYISLPGD